MHLTQGLHRAAQLKPRGVATVFGDGGWTWKELRDRVARLAAAQVSSGMKPGDRVVPIALNSDRYVEIYHAVWRAGGVIAPGNARGLRPCHRRRPSRLTSCASVRQPVQLVPQGFGDGTDAAVQWRLLAWEDQVDRQAGRASHRSPGETGQ